jgi:hypothetical protein
MHYLEFHAQISRRVLSIADKGGAYGMAEC